MRDLAKETGEREKREKRVAVRPICMLIEFGVARREFLSHWNSHSVRIGEVK